MYIKTADRDGFVIRAQEYYEAVWKLFMQAGYSRPLIAEVNGTPPIVSAECIQRRREDVIIDLVPFTYLYGLFEVLFGSIITGSTVVLVPNFTPRAVLEAVEKEKGTVMFGVPAMYNALAMVRDEVPARYDLSSLRLVVTAGAKSFPKLMKTLEDKFDLSVYEVYGLTEASAVSISTPGSRRLGTVGKPICRLKILDDNGKRVRRGEIGEAVLVKKSGDATVVLVGFPSTGKSTLLNALTGTKSEVAAYAFTTLTVVPGAMEYRGAKIQILDIPGLIAGAAMGKGRGKEVIGVVRSADMIVMLVDVFNSAHVDVLMKEIYDAGIRINKPKPDITIKKTSQGGIRVHAVGALDLDIDEIRSILAENKMMNADILIRGNATQDKVIDAMLGNRIYVPAFIAVNKVDLVGEKTRRGIVNDTETRFGMSPVMISAHTGYHMDEVKDRIYDTLGFMRVYLKPQSEAADLEEPLIVRRGSSVEDVCRKLHREFVSRFRYARVWGHSVKHPAYCQGLSHIIGSFSILALHHCV